MPGVPLVAALETEFHATMPEHAARYGVPAEWREKYGVRRYGFHGASHRYVAERAAGMLGVPGDSLRLVSCHLGGSSSMCAIDRGRSVDTTMGFSPQSGLENATRPGELDAFAVLYMMERCGWSVAEVREQLAKGGGLAGLSGVPGGDVRDLEAGRGGRQRRRRPGAGCVHLRGPKDDRRLRRGHGWPGRGRLHRRHRRELPAASLGLLRGAGVSRNQAGRVAQRSRGPATGCFPPTARPWRCWPWLPMKS